MFWFAGPSLVYVPVAIVMLSGTISLEGSDCDPISSFTFRDHLGAPSLTVHIVYRKEHPLSREK